MKVEFRIEGSTLDELEANARAECEQMAGDRSFSFELGEVFSSTDRPAAPIAPASASLRLQGAYRPRTFSGYVTATFEDKATATG